MDAVNAIAEATTAFPIMAGMVISPAVSSLATSLGAETRTAVVAILVDMAISQRNQIAQNSLPEGAPAATNRLRRGKGRPNKSWCNRDDCRRDCCSHYDLL
jgi:hypothetical protein